MATGILTPPIFRFSPRPLSYRRRPGVCSGDEAAFTPSCLRPRPGLSRLVCLLSALSGSALSACRRPDQPRRRPDRRRAAGPARLGLFLFLPALASACEIKLGVDDSTQGPYAAGSTVIFRLRVDLTHQDCPVEMKETKIQGIGLNILGATPWQKTSPNVWERKLKVAIAASPAGKVTLSAKRSCDKDGGWGAYVIESTLLKL